MKKYFLILRTLLISSGNLQARDIKHNFSIQETLDCAVSEGRLNPNIKFYFGNASHPEISKSFGTFVTNKKTNAVGKSDQKACEWVFLSALLALEKRAEDEGGNAVVNIHSFYKKNEMSSETVFECHAGVFVAGVALKGTVVRID